MRERRRKQRELAIAKAENFEPCFGGSRHDKKKLHFCARNPWPRNRRSAPRSGGATLNRAAERPLPMVNRKGDAAAFLTAEDGSRWLAVGGLRDRWNGPVTGEWMLSCTIIVIGC